LIINPKDFQNKFEVSKTKVKKNTSLFNKIMQPFKSTSSPTIKQKIKKLKPKIIDPTLKNTTKPEKQ